MRLSRLAGQCLDAGPNLLKASAVYGLGQVDRVVVTNADEGIKPDQVRLD